MLTGSSEKMSQLLTTLATSRVLSKAILNFATLIVCVGIVVFQCWKCYLKFEESPQGTHLSMERSEDELFPQITICDAFSSVTYDKSILSECKV